MCRCVCIYVYVVAVDVLIGAHGAGLALCVALKPHAVVLTLNTQAGGVRALPNG
jgi:hypothetical protein